MLLERLENNINELKGKIDENVDISEQLLATLEEFSEKVLSNEESLAEVEKPEEYANVVYREKEADEVKKIKDSIKELKEIVESRKEIEDESLKFVFDLTEDQKKFLADLCNDVKKYIEKGKTLLKEQKETQEDIDIYQNITNKFKKGERFDTHDLEVISSNISNADKKEQYEILKEFLTHNIKLEKQKITPVEQNEISAEEVIEKLRAIKEKNEDKEKIESVYNYHKEEVLKEFNPVECEKIEKFLKEKNIFDKFEADIIVAIILYGNLESVKEAYDNLTEKGHIDKSFVFHYPGIWTVQEDKESRKGSIRRKKKEKTGDVNPLIYEVRSMDRAELCNRIDKLIEMGFAYEDICKEWHSFLSSSPQSIMSQLKVFETYGITLKKNDIAKGTKASVLKTGYLAAERCDKMLESGILDPTALPGIVSQETYMNNNASYLQNAKFCNQEHMLLVQTLTEIGEDGKPGIKKEDSDEHLVFADIFGSVNESGERVDVNRLNKNYRENYLGFPLEDEEEYEKFKIQNGMSEVTEKDIKRYKEMQDAIIPNSVDFEEETYNSDFIKELDEKYKLNKFTYSYNNKIISRYKVLRIYESLIKYNEANPENAFDEAETRLFALTYNTFFKEDLLKEIKKECNIISEEEKRRAK